MAATVNDQPENKAGVASCSRDETAEACWGAFVRDAGRATHGKGAAGVAGNYVVIDHGNGEYSLYAHLKPGSIRVQSGHRVTAGTPLGQAKAHRAIPRNQHLHFQVCDAPQTR